ncbi:MAG: hypothetical protein R2780_07010 [Crocinitomicaceae bacterium]
MKFGVPYLFLSPEYMGEVSWLSFMILGFSVGGYFMAFHLYSYIILGPAFPFIATLARPFYKFCINNSVIPVIFYLVLCINIAEVQMNEELMSIWQVLILLLSMTAGIIFFIMLSVFYFFRTNWDISKLQLRRKSNKRSLYFFAGTLFGKKKYWFESHDARIYQPLFYFSSLVKILPARDAQHYKRDVLKDVFRQNQLNASFFEVAIIISFFVLGYFGDYTTVKIPSSASFMLLCTFSIMVLSILYSWFRGWAISIFVVTLVLLNVISTKTDLLQVKNYAYGLNYGEKQEYNLNAIKAIQYDTTKYQNDIQHHEEILNNWYEKSTMYQNTDKPKLVVINCSGGGLRSAMWTFYILQQLYKNTDGTFFQNVHFITGASGGMVGASYFRELELMSQTADIDPTEDKYLKNISKDLLNSVAFSLVMHDIFMRYKKETIEGQTYTQDRGFSFEEQLNENTDYVLNKRLIDYRRPEKSSQIPLMLFTPTIINDGRRLLIGSQPYGFMNGPIGGKGEMGPENVEYIKLFKHNSAQSIRFTSVLRMNSTFPYVLPMVTMPTSPEIQVMDAGIRDNYGTKSTIRYIDAMRDWLEENTSGVVVVEIRDIHKDYDMLHEGRMSLSTRFMRPIGNFYGNYHHAQEYDSVEMFESIDSEELPIDLVTFVLRKDPSEMISLSWHLTQREKNDIKRIFNNDYNQNQMGILIDLLNLKK